MAQVGRKCISLAVLLIALLVVNARSKEPGTTAQPAKIPEVKAPFLKAPETKDSSVKAPEVKASTTKSEISSKKILVFLPVGSRSHHNVFSALTNELLEHGHSVTFVSARPYKDHPRLCQILVTDPFQAFLHNMTKELFKGPTAIINIAIMLVKLGPLTFNAAVFGSHEVMALKNEKFDLVITEAFVLQEPLLAFAHHFGCPSMVLHPVGYGNHLNHVTGGAVNPSYVPFFLSTEMDPENLLDRVRNTVVITSAMLFYHTIYMYLANSLMHRVFPEAPPIQELIKNISITLVNNNNALMDAVPLAPSVIEVAGLHIKPGKPLPADLKKWIEDSEHGFVYFSLGSIVNGDFLPQEKREAIFKSFRKLKQRVLVKWDGEIPANPPNNCRFEKWVPQQEVLAHPNLKVFVSHGGLLSTQESVYFGAAMISMPVFGDQHMNTAMAAKKEIAVKVSIYALTTELLDAALDEVISNPKYRERSKKLSLLFRLDPIPPLEKAVYYTEQLLQLGSLNHLQPSSVNLYWYQYLLLDVLAVIALGLYAFWRIIRCICGICLGCYSKSSKEKKD